MPHLCTRTPSRSPHFCSWLVHVMVSMSHTLTVESKSTTMAVRPPPASAKDLTREPVCAGSVRSFSCARRREAGRRGVWIDEVDERWESMPIDDSQKCRNASFE